MTTLHLRNSISRSPLRRGCLLIAFALCCFALSPAARASSTTWTDTTTGDWFTDANWDNHVPTTTTDAFINNGGTAQINTNNPPDATATAQSLTLGLNAGNSGTVTVDGTNGGSLVVPPGYCPLDFQGIFPGLISVGYQDRGTLIIKNGGTVTSGWGYIAALASPSLTSNGSVTVDGANSTWTIYSPCGNPARLYIGGSRTENGDDVQGGTALLTVTNGGTVIVTNPTNEYSVKVLISGTLTGNGTITTHGDPRYPLSYITAIQGTLAPTGTLNITQNLGFASFGAMLCNVAPGNADNVVVGGTGWLHGRLSVIMTGTFTSDITRYTLLTAAGGWQFNNRFDSYSITYPTGQGFIPHITYDDNIPTHVYLDLVFNHP